MKGCVHVCVCVSWQRIYVIACESVQEMYPSMSGRVGMAGVMCKSGCT